MQGCELSKIHVSIFADAHPNHLSYVYTGLCDLADQGEITLDFSFPWSRMDSRPVYGDVTLLAVVSQFGVRSQKTVVFDMHDRSDKFIYPRLEQCDVYFKRSYYQPDINRLDVSLRSKVLPFGLCFPCRASHEKATFRRIIGNFVARSIPRIGSLPSIVVDTLYLAREHYRGPIASSTFSAKPLKKDRKVIFQTQVYAPDETSDDAYSINGFRVDVIRELKKKFRDRFHGGLLPSKFARVNYPDCIATLSTKRHEYISMLKASAIGVYTRGLHHSTAWKLPEYLATGMCVVAEPPRNELPRPLTPGKHYLPFSTAEECVSACEQLLEDEKLIENMCQANWEYYQHEVDPAKRVMACIRIALQVAQAKSGSEKDASSQRYGAF